MKRETEPQAEAEWEKAVSAAAAKVRSSTDTDLLLYCGDIDFAGWKSTYGTIKARVDRATNVALYITTGGGSADIAYRIASFIKDAYPNGQFSLVVDWYCKSAGTLLAIGADEVVLSDIAELGPLDVQVRKIDELERTSGLTPFQALTALREVAFADFEYFFEATRKMGRGHITTRTSADIASGLVTGLYQRIYGQIDPMRLGELSRSLLIANAYGERLDSSNLKEDALDNLVSGYPAHSFVIDRREAEKLFQNVRAPTKEEQDLMGLLHRLVEQHVDAEEAFVFFLNEDSTNDNDTKEGVPPATAARISDKPAEGSAPTAAPNPGGGSESENPPPVTNGEALRARPKV